MTSTGLARSLVNLGVELEFREFTAGLVRADVSVLPAAGRFEVSPTDLYCGILHAVAVRGGSASWPVERVTVTSTQAEFLVSELSRGHVEAVAVFGGPDKQVWRANLSDTEGRLCASGLIGLGPMKTK